MYGSLTLLGGTHKLLVGSSIMPKVKEVVGPSTFWFFSGSPR